MYNPEQVAANKAANKYYASFGKPYSDADNVVSEQPAYVASQGRFLPNYLLSERKGSDVFRNAS